MSAFARPGRPQYPVFSQSPLVHSASRWYFRIRAECCFRTPCIRKTGKAAFASCLPSGPAQHSSDYASASLPGQRVDPALPAAPAIPQPKLFPQARRRHSGRVRFPRSAVPSTDRQNRRTARSRRCWRQPVRALGGENATGYPVLAFASKWQSDEKAREFSAFYRNGLRKKSKSFELASQSEAWAVAGQNERGLFSGYPARAMSLNAIEGLKSSLN